MLAATALLGLAAAGNAQAASVSFVMDQSNRLDDGTAYLQVTIADGANGAIDFLVQALQPLLDLAGDHFGIQKFGFNVAADGFAEAMDVSGLPRGWRARDGGRMDGFGLYDIRLSGSGHRRVDTLEFSITGVDMDTLLDYAGLSHGRAPQGHTFFSVEVGGLDLNDCKRVAYFGGGDAIVPLPAAAWLFASALGLLGFARRLP